MEEKQLLVIPVTAATVMLLLLCLYAASYVMLMDTCTLYSLSPDGVAPGTVQLGHSHFYLVESDWVETVYIPMNWIDRNIRPDYWKLGSPRELPAGFNLETDDPWALEWDEHGRLIPREAVVDKMP